MQSVEIDPERRIESVVRRVHSALEGGVDKRAVEAEVRGAFAAWGEVKVRDFLPIFVEREVVQVLRRKT